MLLLPRSIHPLPINRLLWAGTLLLCLAPGESPALAEDKAPAEDKTTEPESAETDVLAGHSYHGEAFNAGPRQAAVLIDGLGNVDFKTSAKEEQTQKLFNQGIAALHGFWYLEAERSFRQAAALEPDLAIAYWGMALANTNNIDRARGFIQEAVDRREHASEREQMLIDATAKVLKDPGKEESKEAKERRRRDYFSDLERVLDKYPDDIEIKALLAVEMWMANRAGVPIISYYAVDALLDQVFAANPMHPAHHYRIHLWDSRRAENALESAALCGPSLPGIAHMWHMPGHIYSRLDRYADAAWQQEASARVDHAHMIRTRLMPDEIHNFAHNNEWLTRNLIYLGRVDDALEQSRNLVAMPQHPKYNSMTARGSYRYGRIRLLQTLTEFELWDTLISEANGPYLLPTDDQGWQNERLAWLAVAEHLTGNAKVARSFDRQLRGRLLDLQNQQIELEAKQDGEQPKPTEEDTTEKDATEADAAAAEQTDAEKAEAEKAAKKELERELSRNKSDITELEKYIALQRAAAAVAAKDAKAFEEQIGKAGRIEATLKASWLAQVGKLKEAKEELEKLVKDKQGQVRPLAILVHTLWQLDEREDAVARFETLRKLAADADLTTPLLARLTPVAEHAGLSGNWRIPYEAPDDLGPRPDLESLGPFRWSPYQAPEWTAYSSQGDEITDQQYEGKPRIVIFYLGFGCLHCVEQLTAFAPLTEDFSVAGIEIVGISTENLAELRKGMDRYEESIPFPLLASDEQQAFKDYRCWDDFENQPLHGTFLIDAQGRVRWQDIGYEPFTDGQFLLEEAERLLALPE